MTASEGAADSTAAEPGLGAPAEPARARLTQLEQIAARPLAEHPDGYERLHAELRAALAEIDDA